MIICAGLPKTGSKSCSAALRTLGYNVADFMDTVEFLGITWTQYFDGKIGIDEVIKAYEKHGFDANQDVPGNVYWEELYKASPKGTKVILTVRDSDEVWQRSLKGFWIQETKRDAIFGISVRNINQRVIQYGLMGPEWQSIDTCLTKLKKILPDFVHQSPLLVKNAVDFINKDDAGQAYRKHNLYVKSVVPKEDLLIWNLKDGWEPLCTFLGKEIPAGPIPHDNKTGDVEFLRNYGYRTKVYADGIRTLVKNVLIILAKVGFGLYLVHSVFKKRAE